jgi:hypothetical protein
MKKLNGLRHCLRQCPLSRMNWNTPATAKGAPLFFRGKQTLRTPNPKKESHPSADATRYATLLRLMFVEIVEGVLQWYASDAAEARLLRELLQFPLHDEGTQLELRSAIPRFIPCHSALLPCEFGSRPARRQIGLRVHAPSVFQPQHSRRVFSHRCGSAIEPRRSSSTMVQHWDPDSACKSISSSGNVWRRSGHCARVCAHNTCRRENHPGRTLCHTMGEYRLRGVFLLEAEPPAT